MPSDEAAPQCQSAPPEGKAPSPLRSAGALHKTMDDAKPAQQTFDARARALRLIETDWMV
jgi:hypothetical protein